MTGWMMVFAYALYVPAGIALTSAYASQLLSDTVHVSMGGWVLFVIILAAVSSVAYLLVSPLGHSSPARPDRDGPAAVRGPGLARPGRHLR
jgi:amino acid transporter